MPWSLHQRAMAFQVSLLTLASFTRRDLRVYLSLVIVCPLSMEGRGITGPTPSSLEALQKSLANKGSVQKKL
jgi:hypothetical protein